MLKNGLLVRPMSRTCFIRCAFLDCCKRPLAAGLASEVRHTGKTIDQNDLLLIP